jgi:bifunctional non-homologous end joining protein LigD
VGDTTDNSGERAGVALTSLDSELFGGADATKRDLIDYLDAVRDQIIGQLADRPLSVVRVRPGQAPFMQKNVPKYAPDFVRTITVWAESSHREVAYALCNDRRTLLWFANQRAVEYHPTLVRAGHFDNPDVMVLDIDPPPDSDFGKVVQVALLVREALASAGLAGAVKTSGAKGVHIIVPLAEGQSSEDAAAATRAIAARAERLGPSLATTAFIREDRGGKVFIDATRAGGATVVAAYSPRVRPGTTVSYPVGWDDLGNVRPADFTVRNAAGLLAGQDRWARLLPDPQLLPAEIVAEGNAIPIARVAAMHEGKRRARARRDQAPAGGSGRDS